jgi:hypothetical protein
MNKQYILEKIQEIVKSDGTPPGMQKFEKITGLKRTDWYGKHWARWSDALTEAGFEGNKYNQAYPKETVLKLYLDLVIELQKVPSTGEIRIKCNNDTTYPGHTTFQNALGNRNEQLTALLEYARAQNAPAHIIELIANGLKAAPIKSTEKKSAAGIGYVYLIKFGDFFKIGRSNDFDRRLREIKTKLPEEGELIHVIETDDPEGIEAYWHNRFKNCRAKGEWFKLSNDDVKALRKRKFM